MKHLLLGIFILIVKFSYSQEKVFIPKNNIEIYVDNTESEFLLFKEGKQQRLSAISFYNVWANKPVKYYTEGNSLSDLETKLLLESTDGKSLMEEFNKQHNSIRNSNCLLLVPLRPISLEYDIDKSKIFIIKPEKIAEIKYNKLQFEEIILDIPKGFEVSHRKITNDNYWNYYYFPISDTRTALNLEKNKETMTLAIEFKVATIEPGKSFWDKTYIYGTNEILFTIFDNDSREIIWQYKP